MFEKKGLLISGDLAPTKVNKESFANHQVEQLFGDVLPVLQSRERVICNLECSITDNASPIPKCGANMFGYMGTCKTLRLAGFTDVGLANNHAFDFGDKGLEDTIVDLNDSGLNWYGIGLNRDEACRLHTIILDGKSIGIIALSEHEYTYATDKKAGCASYTEYEICLKVAKAKEECDFVIVLYHGGNEFCQFPSPRLHGLCHTLAKLGADAVLCQHSHIIGCYEYVDDCLIVYGQGNFHFVSKTANNSFLEGLMLLVDLEEDKLRFEFEPVVAAENGIGIRLATKAEKEKIISNLETNSEKLKNGEWYSLWSEFVKGIAPHYRQVIAQAYLLNKTEGTEMFAHFLDCESHLDILKELHKSACLTGKIRESKKLPLTKRLFSKSAPQKIINKIARLFKHG